MALIKTVRGATPQFGANCYLADNATIIGDVIAGDECSFWFQAVVRGDVHQIRMGNKVNVQDGAIIHCTYERAPTTIGNNVSIGHRAIVHGCTLEDNVLIGMGAIVMDGVVIEDDAMIAAGALVTPGTQVPSGTLYAGSPARCKRKLSDEEIAFLLQSANNYLDYVKSYEI